MATTPHSQTADWVGQSIKRKEDARLVRGKGKFVDDIKLLGMLHLVFVRSPYAHAKITGVDDSRHAATRSGDLGAHGRIRRGVAPRRDHAVTRLALNRSYRVR